MSNPEPVRIDKYLWAIRIYKTRSLATDACKAGKVKLDGTSVKPSQVVKIGQEYTIQKDAQRKIINVLAIIEKRVDAKLAALAYEDKSPVNDEPKHHSVFTVPVLKRDRGTGRPTKRDRREIDGIQSSWEKD